MDCVELLSGGGEVCVQLLYALGATYTPPSGRAASYNSEMIGGNSERPLLGGIVRYHPCPPGRGVKSGRPRAFIPVLRRRCGVLRFITTKCTYLKAIDGERAGPGVFPQAGEVTLHLGHTGARGGGEELIFGGGASIKLCQWDLIPRVLYRTSRRVGDVGETPIGDMGPWC